MRRAGIAAALSLAFLLAAVAGVVASAADASATLGSGRQGATISVTPSSVAVGETTRVDFDRWPEGIATAQVCGNRAQRGSSDCDQLGAASARIPDTGASSVTIRVLEPPVGCPCVVRATSLTGSVVRIAPIDLIGVPGGVDIPAVVGPPSAVALQVQSSLQEARTSFPRSWAGAFGAPVDHELVLTVRNLGDHEVAGLRVAGTVGHHERNGDPFSAPLPPVPAGATRTVHVPVTVPMPSWGSWHVTGAIYGATTPIEFTVKTKHDPWALELAVPLALLLVARVLRIRERRRRARDASAVAVAAAAATAARSPQFPECSPGVGPEDDGRWAPPPYDHDDMFLPEPLRAEPEDTFAPAASAGTTPSEAPR
jgi:hypothetical protein